MELITKSIQKKPGKSDGIRICVMRRVKPEFVFDIWMPSLAPSTELLRSYHDKAIDWKKYEKLYEKEVLGTQQKYLKIILDIVKKNNVTLLCWEEKAEMCHRRLLAEKLKSIEPKLSVKVT